ncbi:hypothetical protein JL720_5238 [Aureococcus anophagefferens]|nr:hypothetical protein JL720_5238 [Aureococcus anophagefferens]
MVLFNTMILMFGGRSNEVRRNHVPKTYEIETVNGTIDFVSYDKNPIVDARAVDDSPEAAATLPAHYVCDNQIDVGLYFNDVWAYELNCTRYGDLPCVEHTWTVLNYGRDRGGCKYILGREICTHPSERWLHGAAMFLDSTMLIYGGFSQRCEDYCDDLWSFDARDGSWMEIQVGHFNPGESPGKRWKFSIVADGTTFYIFGGFRLWHGFSSDNSEDNRAQRHVDLRGHDLLPYLSTDGPGSGLGVVAKPTAQGFIPFPDYPYYLDDLWFYNLTDGYWTLIAPVSSSNRPASPSQAGCRFNDWYAPDPNNSALNFGTYNGAPFYGIVDARDRAGQE